jgi:hypothetical protein
MSLVQRYPNDDPRVIAMKKAVKAAGGLTQVGRHFHVTAQAIYKWRICPPDRCQQMEIISGVSVHELRPDVFGVKPHRAAAC